VFKGLTNNGNVNRGTDKSNIQSTIGTSPLVSSSIISSKLNTSESTTRRFLSTLFSRGITSSSSSSTIQREQSKGREDNPDGDRCKCSSSQGNGDTSKIYRGNRKVIKEDRREAHYMKVFSDLNIFLAEIGDRLDRI
jgi:hypothetical protein